MNVRRRDGALWLVCCVRATLLACRSSALVRSRQLYPRMNAWMLLEKFFFCYKAWSGPRRANAHAHIARRTTRGDAP